MITKKNILRKKVLFWFLQLFVLNLLAQAPSLINYQGSARMANGIPLGNKTIGIKFEIRDGSSSGSIVASETQVVQTNLLGLFVTQIGKNTNLASVNWQSGTKFLEVSIDTTGGSNYTSLGTQQMVSVPYAMNAAQVPSSYTGNVLTIGSSSFALTPTMAVTPNTSITVSGLGTVTSVGTNTFDINIPTPTFTGLGTATVSGTYPTYTVSSDIPTFTNTGQQIVTGAYPNFTVNTPTVAAAADQTLTPTGLVTISNPVTNSFVIGVQSPTFTSLGASTVTGSYPNYTVNSDVPTFTNSGQPIIVGAFPNFTVNTPTVSAVPNQTLTPSGLVTVSNPATNSFVIGVQSPTFTNAGQAIITGAYPSFTVNTPTVAAVPNQTLTPSGIVTVANPATNSFVIGVQTPSFTNSGQSIITGSYPSFTVNTPTVVPPPTVAGAGIATVSGAPAYVVNVAAPVFNNTGQNIITGTYPTFSVNTPTVPAAITPTIAVTTTAAANAAVSSSGSSFNINVPPPAFTNSGPATITGTYPNYVINSTAVPNTSVTVTSTAAAGPSVSAIGTNSFNINIPPQAASWALLGNAGTNPATNFIGTTDLQDLNIRTNSIDRIKIASTGNVGVGSGYNPDAPFVAQGNGPNLGALKLYNSHASGGDKTFLGFNVSSGSDFFDIARIGSERSGGGGEGRLYFMTGGQGSQLERMRVDEFGNVGIGTTAPVSKLHVVTTPTVTGVHGVNVSVTSALATATNNGVYSEITGSSSGYYISGEFNAIRTPASSSGTAIAVKAFAKSNNPTNGFVRGVEATATFGANNIGLSGTANGGPGATNYGLYATASGGSTNWAGWLEGHTAMNGKLAMLGQVAAPPTAAGQGVIYYDQTANKLRVSQNNGAYVDLLSSTVAWSTTGNAGTAPGTNFIGTTDAQALSFRTNNTLVADMSSVGYMGIGSVPGFATTRLSLYGSENATGLNAFSAAPGTAIRIHNNDLTNNNFSSLIFSSQASNAANFEAAKIVGQVTDHTTGSIAGDLVFMVRSPANILERMRIKSSGDIGIGTSSPNGHFHVNSQTSNHALTRLTSSLATTGLVTYIDGASAAITNYENTPFYFGVNVASRMSISPAGNVNIMTGVGLATEKLNVDGNISLEDAAASNAPNRVIGFPTASPGWHGSLTLQAKDCSFTGAAAGGGDLLLNGGDYNVGSANPTGSYGGNVHISTGRNLWPHATGAAITFLAGTSTTPERMRIDGATGFVGIGTTAPDQMLTVNGNASKPGGGAWATFSDRRLKKDIHSYNDGLKELLRIEPVWYTYNGEAGLPENTYIGIIAQDLQGIAPYMVKETNRGEGTPNYLSVDNSAMTYMIINAVKEQQKQIEDLKKVVEEQKKITEEQKKLIDQLLNK